MITLRSTAKLEYFNDNSIQCIIYDRDVVVVTRVPVQQSSRTLNSLPAEIFQGYFYRKHKNPRIIAQCPRYDFAVIKMCRGH